MKASQTILLGIFRRLDFFEAISGKEDLFDRFVIQNLVKNSSFVPSKLSSKI
jgi:hypothetical protein